MPHATNEYPFEWRVLSAVHSRLASLLELCDEGASIVVVMEARGQSGQGFDVRVGLGCDDLRRLVDDLRTRAVAHLVLAPLDDGREFQSLSWASISRTTMEAWLGEPLTAADFVSHKAGASREGQYPESWEVMF